MKCEFCKEETKETDMRLVQFFLNVCFDKAGGYDSADTAVQEHFICKSCFAHARKEILPVGCQK